jgi:hypothetical protein
MIFALRVALAHLPRRNVWLLVFYVGSTVTTWALFLATYRGHEPLVMYVVLPFVLFGVFLGARRTLQAATV